MVIVGEMDKFFIDNRETKIICTYFISFKMHLYPE
jgi:hypothetical protein